MTALNDLLGAPSGARWLKADLHVHTPASADIDEKWKATTPDEVVQLALDKGLDVIGIADHNTAAWCDQLVSAAQATGLTVLPGVEVSTPQGHVVALFDTETPASEIEDLLIALGIPRTQFGSLHVVTEGGIQVVSKKVSEHGGIAIAAHADGEKGFLEMIKAGAERRRAYAAPDLWAMEVLDPAAAQRYQAGTVSGYPRRMPCIQASDCWPRGADRHQLDGMAYRHTFVKMDERSLSGLKLALIDPDIRVRLETQDRSCPRASVVGIWVSNGFLEGERLRFNENVNCLIGDTGTGKSLIVELLRFALDQQPGVPKIHQEVTKQLEEQLGALGRVHVLLLKDDDLYLVERAWTRTADPPVVQRVHEMGELEPVEVPEMRLFFPIKAFSQSEIIEFAREPAVRLSLTDDLIDIATEASEVRRLKSRLAKNATGLMSERAKASEIERRLQEMASLVASRDELDKALADPQIKGHQLWDKEQSFFDHADQSFTALSTTADSIADDFAVETNLPDDLSGFPNELLLGELLALQNEWNEGVGTLAEHLAEKHRLIFEKLGELRGRWQTGFDAAEDAYQTLLQSIDKDGAGLKALDQRRRRIQNRISSLEDEQRELESKVAPAIAKLEAEREELLDALQKNRREITHKREEKAKDLSTKLDEAVRLSVHANAAKEKFRAGIKRIAEGSRLYEADLDKIASCHPVPLVKGLLAEDWAALHKLSGVEEMKLQRLWEVIVERDRLPALYELQLTDVDDVIDVLLRVSGDGSYKELEKLSHGQKCMVVLMVALAEGDFPLLVDQPEDALHAPGIESGIVSTLRSRRGARQCIFATRNANILVSADAEQIIAMQADATKGEVAKTGSLDKFDQRELVIHHVEGGPDAFRRRQTMYALRPLA